VIEARTPSDFVLVLAALSYRDEWVSAAGVAGALDLFNHGASVRQVASRLSRMARESCRAFKVQRDSVGCLYRVSSFGETWVRNYLPGLDGKRT
jgi:hypothetical protein